MFVLASCVMLPTLGWAQTTGTGSYIPPGNYRGTAVPPSPLLLGIYDDDNVQGTFEGDNAWLGRPIDFASIHSGMANEQDFLQSVDYVLNSSGYHALNAAGVADSRLISIPLIWVGASLQSGASGAYDSDYTSVAKVVLSDIPAGPAPGQSIIYVRTGWEQNQGGMPWSASGQETAFQGAFQHFVNAFRAVDTNHRFRFVWCPNVGGDPIAPTYPGDAYVDVIAMDFYYGLNNYTNSPDPDTAFQEMLNPSTGDGLSTVASMASSHGKALAFGEWGVDQDNFGNYVKDFYDWCRSNKCLYATYWNNDGSYPGKISDGSYPETGAMFRHLFDATNYPVEPIAAPVGVAALAGTSSNEVTSSTVTSSTPVTTYFLYKGTTSGGESIAPVATNSSPAFNDTQAAGKTAYYRVGAGNSLSQGYLSAEVSATPHAPGSPPPPDYLAITSTGYASSTTRALEKYAQYSGDTNHPFTGLYNASIVALVKGAQVSPGSGPGLVAGFQNGVTLALASDNRLVGFSRDQYNNQFTATSTIPVPFPPNGSPEWVRADVDARGATTTFYVAPVNGSATPALTSTTWSQLGAPIIGQNNNGIFAPSSEPFSVGGFADGTSQFVGSIYDVIFYVVGTSQGTGEVTVARPRFDQQVTNTVTFTDGYNKAWTVTGPALIK